MPETIEERLRKEEFGILNIQLNPGYVFHKQDDGRITVEKHSSGRFKWTETTMSGNYRSKHQINELQFELEIIEGVKVLILYESIEDYQRLADLPS